MKRAPQSRPGDLQPQQRVSDVSLGVCDPITVFALVCLYGAVDRGARIYWSGVDAASGLVHTQRTVAR